MPGFTALLSHRLSTAPASLNVYFRSAAGWKALVICRVISGHVSRLQVRLRHRAVFVFTDACCSAFRFDARGPGLAPSAAASCARSLPAHSPRISQAAAAARIVGKPGIHTAAENGDVALVRDHIVADPACLHLKDQWGYDPSNMQYCV